MPQKLEWLIYGSSAVVLVIVYYAFSVYTNRRKYRHIPGRELKGISGIILGHSVEILKNLSAGNLIPTIFVEDIEKYGSVVKYFTPNSTIVHTVDPDAIREILVTEDFQKNPLIYRSFGYPYEKRFLGTGLVTDLNHEHWKQRRALFNPGFHRQELLEFISVFNLKTDILIEKLHKFANSGKMISLFEEISNTTSDLIASVAFGIETDAINDTNDKLNSSIREVAKGVFTFITERNIPLNNLSKQLDKKEFSENLTKLRKFAENKILERIELIKNGEYTQNDIFSRILKGADKDNFDMEAMIDDFLTFFIAGQETTSTALAFFFLQVSRMPEIMKKVEDEIHEVLGERSHVTMDDLNKLRYTDAVWKEVLRLYPPAASFSRLSTKDIVINGLKVPSGCVLMCSPFSSGRCANFFPDPLKFDPDRFYDESKKKDNLINAYTYFPFSIGSRNCIGQNFAAIEGKVIIVKLIQRFYFMLDENQSFDIIQRGATIKAKDGVRCIVKAKNT